MTDTNCNLTLNRADWLTFAACLKRTGQPNCIKAAAAIETELGDRESMDMDRELDKWEAIVGPAYSKAKRADQGAFGRLIPQLSAAKFTAVR